MDDVQGGVLLIATTMIVLVAFVLTVLAIMIIYRKRKLEHVREIGSMNAKFQQELLQTKLEVQQQTLQHIGREIHDNLGEKASLIKLYLNTLPSDNPVTALQKIEDTKDLTRQLIVDLKSLSLSLNSDRITQEGLLPSIEQEATRLNRSGQFQCTLSTDGALPKFDGNITTILFRMSQEIINNAVKHSQAKAIDISLTATGKLFTLVFNDDGIGFDTRKKAGTGSSGLINLRARAKLINAQISIQSKEGKGTRISIALPT